MKILAVVFSYLFSFPLDVLLLCVGIVIKKIKHGRAEISNLSSSVQLDISRGERSERVRYRDLTRDKFHISKLPCIVLFII